MHRGQHAGLTEVRLITLNNSEALANKNANVVTSSRGDRILDERPCSLEDVLIRRKVSVVNNTRFNTAEMVVAHLSSPDE